jgi:hypothetical protein
MVIGGGWDRTALKQIHLSAKILQFAFRLNVDLCSEQPAPNCPAISTFVIAEFTCKGFHMSILRRTSGPRTLGKHRLTYASRYATASVLRQLSNREATPRTEQNSSTTSENTSRASDSIVSVNNRRKRINHPKKIKSSAVMACYWKHFTFNIVTCHSD